MGLLVYGFNNNFKGFLKMEKVSRLQCYILCILIIYICEHNKYKRLLLYTDIYYFVK